MPGEHRTIPPSLEHDEFAREVLALADGRLPDGVEPDSAQGRYYRALIDHVRADVARAPELSPAELAPVVVLLRGSGRAA